jgi:uncharacterized membrane protein YgdD (TMEM256/DUF423 family)
MRSLIFLAAVFGFVGVGLGAFGAHALRDRLAPAMLEVYRTGVQYHLAHALAMLMTGLLADRWRGNPLLPWSGRLFGIGIVLFSGSLYLLSVSGARILGAVTPLGGLCFLAGWALLAVAAARETRE